MAHCRGLYIGKYPPRGEISIDDIFFLGGGIRTVEEEMRENIKQKRRKEKEKEQKWKET
jgi:hypothetical protein